MDVVAGVREKGVECVPPSIALGVGISSHPVVLR